MQTRKRKIAIIAVSIGVFAFIFCLRYNYINTKYPNPISKEYLINETFTYQGVEMLLSNFQLTDYDEFLEDYNLDPHQMNIDIKGLKQKNVVVTLHVKNSSDAKKEINAGELMLLETDGWVGYTDLMDSFRLLNNGKTAMIVLNPGEEDSLRFSYCLYDISFNESDFNNLEKSVFRMVLSLYPQKTIVKLN